MPERYRGPRDPLLHRQWRSERRSAVLAHHPDRGGDPGRLQGELDRLDERFGTRDRPQVDLAAPGRLQPLTRVLRRSSRGVRRGTRRARARLPRGWPGHRRYLEL